MPGSKKGGGQSKHLRPIRSTDDPRYKKLAEGRERYNEGLRTRKLRRAEYQDRLSEIKAQQLDIAQRSIETGEVPEPMELLLDLIKQQQVAMANPELKANEASKERALMLDLQKQYTNMLNAMAPSTQSIEIKKADEEEMSEEDFLKRFQEYSDSMPVVNNDEDAE